MAAPRDVDGRAASSFIQRLAAKMKRLAIRTWGRAVIAACLLPAAASAHVGFTLAIGEPIGATDGSQCSKPHSKGSTTTAWLTIETSQIASWTPLRAALAVNLPEAYDGGTLGLADRCFALYLDDQPPVLGLVLSTHSERLADMPTLWVGEKSPQRIELSLRTGNLNAPLFSTIKQLDAIFEYPAHLETQLARLRSCSQDPSTYAELGAAWSKAVGALIEEGRIHAGSDMDDLLVRLGPPTREASIDGNQRSFWYFQTPMHTNPFFWAESDGKKARSLHLGKI